VSWLTGSTAKKGCPGGTKTTSRPKIAEAEISSARGHGDAPQREPGLVAFPHLAEPDAQPRVGAAPEIGMVAEAGRHVSVARVGERHPQRRASGIEGEALPRLAGEGPEAIRLVALHEHRGGRALVLHHPGSAPAIAVDRMVAAERVAGELDRPALPREARAAHAVGIGHERPARGAARVSGAQEGAIRGAHQRGPCVPEADDRAARGRRELEGEVARAQHEVLGRVRVHRAILARARGVPGGFVDHAARRT
jgi:hypothetical protein